MSNGSDKWVIGAIAAAVGWYNRKTILHVLDDVVALAQLDALEKERKRQYELRLEALKSSAKPPTKAPLPTLDLEALRLPPKVESDARWREIIQHPSVVLILGKRGSGKSALGYRLLELFRYGPRPYVVGIPSSAKRLLPEWIGVASTLDEVPPKSIALIDEAYLPFHARGSMAQESKAMSQLLNLSRQRDQTLIFVSQEARQVDRNIASSANVVVFKQLGILQLEFDRPELNKLANQAKEALDNMKGDDRSGAFVYAPDADFQGLLGNELPTFWKLGLSRLFATGASPATTRAPKPLSPKDKAQEAKKMRAKGASLREIARTLGVSRGTVVNYLKGYPYKPRST